MQDRTRLKHFQFAATELRGLKAAARRRGLTLEQHGKKWSLSVGNKCSAIFRDLDGVRDRLKGLAVRDHATAR